MDHVGAKQASQPAPVSHWTQVCQDVSPESLELIISAEKPSQPVSREVLRGLKDSLSPPGP